MLFIPKLTADNTCHVVFSATKCLLQDLFLQKKREIGELEAGLYKLHTNIVDLQIMSVNSISMSQWHTRLGHPSLAVLKSIPSLDVHNKSDVSEQCDVYQFSKQSRIPFLVRDSKSNECFDLIHCGVWGPYRHFTHGKCNSFLTIVDDHSKCTWLFLFSDKSQVPALIMNFITYVSTQFKKIVKILRTDNGTEFISCVLSKQLLNLGILHQTSCPYTSQQNGIAERKHQHLLKVARALRFQSNVPISLWGDCVLTTTHLINLLPVV